MLEEKTFQELFYGELSIASWQFLVLVMSLGALLRVLMKFKRRVVREKPFSVVYFITQLNNWFELLSTIILMYFLIRFYGDYQELIVEFIPDKLKPSIYAIMFGIGFYLHKISDLIYSKLSKK
tara:strand:+ start:99 stop:467 length:369 start_codon:yes stop_codon:yes gene_type:complete